MKFHPAAELIPMMDDAEFAELAQDISINGLIDDILTYEDAILDGRNRFMACEKVGVKPRFKPWDGDSPVTFVVSKNLHRRHLEKGQKAMIAADALRLLEKEAEARQKSGLKRGTTVPVREKIPEREKGKATEKAAEIFDVNPRYVADAKVIKEKAPELAEAVKSGSITLPKAKEQVDAELIREKSPELADAVRDGKISLSRAKRELKRQETKEKLETIAKFTPKLPEGEFDVMNFDPPWPVEKIERDCRPNQTKELDYPLMSIEQIKALDWAKKFAALNCHVFLWVPQKFLPVAFEVLQEWRVNYCFTMAWHKPGGFQAFGRPQSNVEFCLYGRLGTPEFFDTKNFFMCFKAPRAGHSSKPHLFYSLLRRVTAGRRADCFNRRKIKGFIGIGLEAK